MQNPWLSILIPAYNVAPWLRDCLLSITCQADKSIEIIVLDDCSTDTTATLLQSLVNESAIPIQSLQHSYNRGLSASRNTLLESARGHYVWFIDSDDILLPGAIAELKAIITRHEPDLVMCDYLNFIDGQPINPAERMASFYGPAGCLLQDPDKLFEGIYRNRRLHIWSKISKRSLWDTQLRFPEGRVMEDMVVSPRLALRTCTYYYQANTWIGYRKRQGSILNSLNLKRINDMSIANANVLQEWLAYYPQLSGQARFAFYYFCIRVYYFTCKDLRLLYPGQKVDMTLYRQRLLEHLHLTKTQLLVEYLKNGRVLPMLRFVLRY